MTMGKTNGTGRRLATCAVGGLLLAAAACALPGAGGGNGETYSLNGDPWAQRDGAAKNAPAKNDAAAATPAAGAAGAAQPGGATVLEQLEEARARVKALETESATLKNDVASLTALIEQLKRENQNLAQLSDAATQGRAVLDQEIDKLRQSGKESDARCRSLADDLLAERIQRVRVERELILAKVKEAETRDDGP
jgi:predicted RNase H-like nuclease (RuvC/YqgF family)